MLTAVCDIGYIVIRHATIFFSLELQEPLHEYQHVEAVGNAWNNLKQFR